MGRIFETLDTSGDGLLSWAEFEVLLQAPFLQLASTPEWSVLWVGPQETTETNMRILQQHDCWYPLLLGLGTRM